MNNFVLYWNETILRISGIDKYNYSVSEKNQTVCMHGHQHFKGKRFMYLN